MGKRRHRGLLPRVMSHKTERRPARGAFFTLSQSGEDGVRAIRELPPRPPS
ncbi:MAG: hypothetical protein ACK55I_42100 [bacterium]